MKVIGIIPARFASMRFPGKPLVMIDGKSMVMRVYEQCKKSRLLDRVIVATDDDRIKTHVLEHGGEVVLTSADHQSGTDRCAEVLSIVNTNAEVVINIQGDEPFIQPEQIEELIKCFSDSSCCVATLARKIISTDVLLDENKVKVVRNNNNDALYFSRQAIPFYKNSNVSDWINKHNYLQHVGMYGFRCKTLLELSKLKQSALEKCEMLEQLRWMEYGYTIKVAETQYESYGIDSPDDLLKLGKSVDN